MPYRLHKCRGVKEDGVTKCEKLITWSFAICAECEEIYGNSALGWPDWLRDSWNAEQRRRRRYYRESKHEISFTDLELAMGMEDE